MTVQYKEIESSRLINWYKTSDSWFWVDGSINIYRGCEHSCVYCDGKSEFYRISDFGTIIRVKKKADQKVRRELVKKGFIPQSMITLDNHLNMSKKSPIHLKNKISTILAIGGGVCDVYQPAEKKFGMTRRVLEVMKQFEIPIIILTKSSLVCRDLQLLKEINERTYANVCFSVTLADENVKKIFEPHSSSTKARFKALKQLRREGIHGGIMFMPILPNIGDTEENIEEIIIRTKNAKGEFIIAGGLTLKPGRNKQEYIETLQRYYPHLVELYERYYGNNNRYGIPNEVNYSQLMRKINQLCQKENIPDRIPRYVPNKIKRENFILSTLIHNLVYYKQYIEKTPFYKVNHLQKIAKQIERTPLNIKDKSLKDVSSLLKTKGKKGLQLIEEYLKEGDLQEIRKYMPSSWPIFCDS